MIDVWFLTWRYIAFNKGRIGLLVAIVTLVALFPFSLNFLLVEPVSAVPQVRGSLPDAVLPAVGAIALLVTVLALALELWLRRAEVLVLARTGCSPGRIRGLLALEVVFIVSASGVLVVLALAVLHGLADDLPRLAFLT